MASERAPAAASNRTATRMAGVDTGVRDVDTVAGVCVTGGGPVGAIAHGHGAEALGVRGDDWRSDSCG